jgi:hypothetical protein
MKWFTSSSAQYVKWLAMLAIRDISNAPLLKCISILGVGSRDSERNVKILHSWREEKK